MKLSVKYEIVGIGTVLICLAAKASLEPYHRWELAGFAVAMLTGLAISCLCRLIARLVVSALAVCLLLQQPLQAQSSDERLPAYAVSFTNGISITMPEDPHQEHLGIIAGGVCVVGGAALVGWLGYKLFNACMDAWEHQLTNNPAGGGEQSPTVPEPVPSPFVNDTIPGSQHGCQCTGAAPPAGQPLPLLIEHSSDGQQWTQVARGPSIGEPLWMPDTGFWRVTALPLVIDRDGTLHCPPGVLERSGDLRTWEVVAVNGADTDVAAEEGGFYRVRVQ